MWVSIPSRRASSASFANGFPSSLRFWEVAHRLAERMDRRAVAINQPTPYLPQCYLFDSDIVLFAILARLERFDDLTTASKVPLVGRTSAFTAGRVGRQFLFARSVRLPPWLSLSLCQTPLCIPSQTLFRSAWA